MAFTVVGFGTLLNTASTAQTIAKAGGKTYRPVIVPGFRRLFNLRPDHYEPSYKLTDSGIEAAAMNIEPAADEHQTGKAEAPPAEVRFNGLAFTVDEGEFEALDQRERYYERVEVDIIDFESRQALGRAYAYSSKPDARWIERDPAKLLPLWRDIAWARRGAYRFGEAFGQMYDQTTFLADGSTLMVDHYAAILHETDDAPDPT